MDSSAFDYFFMGNSLKMFNGIKKFIFTINSYTIVFIKIYIEIICQYIICPDSFITNLS
jgi:hypothetical protein